MYSVNKVLRVVVLKYYSCVTRVIILIYKTRSRYIDEKELELYELVLLIKYTATSDELSQKIAKYQDF